MKFFRSSINKTRQILERTGCICITTVSAGSCTNNNFPPIFFIIVWVKRYFLSFPFCAPPHYPDPITPWVQAVIVSAILSGVWPCAKVKLAQKIPWRMLYILEPCGKWLINVLVSLFDWYDLTILTPFKSRYQYWGLLILTGLYQIKIFNWPITSWYL